MRILLSNDDGFDSPGILQLFHRLEEAGHDVTVVAPSRERSTAGHSLTLHKPLRIAEMGRRVYSVSGSPADSVYVATRFFLKQKPDLCVTGINRGANLGNDIFYSGTVAAAREAYLFGIPSIATSLCYGFPERNHTDYHWESGTQIVSEIVQEFEKKPQDLFLNVNIPNLPHREIKGVQWCHQGRRHYSNEIIEHLDPRGRPYYWVGGGPKGFDTTPGTDCEVVSKGFVAVVPLKVDTTDETALRNLRASFSFT